jgi:hypothetical protein
VAPSAALSLCSEALTGHTGWRDIPNPDGSIGWTAAIEASYYADEASFVRIGIKSGNYGSGAALVRIGTDREQVWSNSPAQAAYQARGTFAAVAASLLALMIFAAQPAQAQMPQCDNVAGRGVVCPNQNFTFNAGFALQPTALSGLGACGTTRQGEFQGVSNGDNSPVAGAAVDVNTTGTTKVPVFCNGGDWRYGW